MGEKEGRKKRRREGDGGGEEKWQRMRRMREASKETIKGQREGCGRRGHKRKEKEIN